MSPVMRITPKVIDIFPDATKTPIRKHMKINRVRDRAKRGVTAFPLGLGSCVWLIEFDDPGTAFFEGIGSFQILVPEADYV